MQKQGKEYGLYFVEIQGGFTFTNRTLPNSFNVQPLLVYKIYVDGRPDELVRGVDLIGTPLTTFSNVSAASDKIGIFNGVCGAESGGVPVSASSPSLMVSTIEVQKKDKSQAKPPFWKTQILIKITKDIKMKYNKFLIAIFSLFITLGATSSNANEMFFKR